MRNGVIYYGLNFARNTPQSCHDSSGMNRHCTDISTNRIPRAWLGLVSVLVHYYSERLTTIINIYHFQIAFRNIDWPRPTARPYGFLCLDKAQWMISPLAIFPSTSEWRNSTLVSTPVCLIGIMYWDNLLFLNGQAL